MVYFVRSVLPRVLIQRRQQLVNRKRCLSAPLTSFPWRQDLDHDRHPNDSFLNKFIGLMLLRRAVKNNSSYFSMQEFSAGIELAVKAIGECITSYDVHNHLKNFLGPTLHSRIKQALSDVQTRGLSIDMEIASVRAVNISRARFVCGFAEPGDEHIMELFGQQIITSRRVMEETILRDNENSSFNTYKEARVIGANALLNGLKFQIDIKIMTHERFYIYDPENDSNILQGLNKLRKVQHLWRFESPIDMQSDESRFNIYPLDWIVVDMDNICDST